MTARKLLHCALLSATAVVANLATPSAAQRIEQIYAFGDSYADDGNAFELGLVSPTLAPLYPTRRFTGGTNYIDTLSDLLDAPVFNFAVGGARANPDFLFEVGAFTAGGGGVFPTVTPAFDENDLVTVSIGGNDARAYGSLPGASVGAAPAAALPAIAATEAGLDTLVAAGAPTISFLAGNTGELPEVAGNPSVAAIRTAYSTAFNQGVQQVLAGYAADGVMVHYLDLSLVLQQVRANPAAYGLTAINCPAFPDLTCLLNGGAGYLIYGDLLHPTSAGSAIIARYVAAQLQAPLTLGASTDLALDSALQFGRVLGSRLDLDGGREGLHLFVVGDSLSRDMDESESTDAYDIDSVGATAGVSYGFANGVVGIAGNYARPRARFGGETSETKTTSYRIGAFAGLEFGGAFAQAHVGFGQDRHRITRAGVLDPVVGRPDGSHVIAGASLGYLVPMGSIELGPVAAVDYGKAKVEGYTEEGDPALTLNVEGLSGKSLTGSIGVQLRGKGSDGEVGALRPFLSAAVENELSADGREVRFAQTSAPVIVNRWDLGEQSTKAYGRVSGGGSARIFGGMELNALVSATLGQAEGDEASVQLGLQLGL